MKLKISPKEKLIGVLHVDQNFLAEPTNMRPTSRVKHLFDRNLNEWLKTLIK